MKEVTEAFGRYIARYPNEREHLTKLATFIQATPDDQLFHRKNFTGHITGSAFVIDRAHSAMLLIHHAFLKRWLQPGGHVDPGETPLQAAIREVKEEIGIEASELKLIAMDAGEPDVPLDIDSHPIPPNANKKEDAHVHHDFRFLFEYTGNGNFALDEKEIAGCKWMSFEELMAGATFRRVVEKITCTIKDLPRRHGEERLENLI